MNVELTNAKVERIKEKNKYYFVLWACEECIELHTKYEELHNHSLKGSYSIPICNQHIKEKEFYCEECNKYFCSICKYCISNHTIYDLDSISSSIKINDIKYELQIKNKELENYYSKLRNDYINKMNKASEDGLKKNKLIIQLGNILIDDYSDNKINDYLLSKNIINNTHLSLKEYPESEASTIKSIN